jgi:hypothetical protein
MLRPMQVPILITQCGFGTYTGQVVFLGMALADQGRKPITSIPTPSGNHYAVLRPIDSSATILKIMQEPPITPQEIAT